MQNFDFNEALKAIQSGKPITGSDGVLAPLIKQLTEAALSAEIDSYLEQNPSKNRHNGYSKKTIKSTVGSFELETEFWTPYAFICKLFWMINYKVPKIANIKSIMTSIAVSINNAVRLDFTCDNEH